MKIYFKNLDSLRFFAFFAVFLFHSFYTPFETIKSHEVYNFFYHITRNGHLGVNFFFVLSGFLITYLLLAEEKKNGKIAIKDFYVRRVLRIWPLYFLMVFIGFVVYPLIRQKLGDHPAPETSNPFLFLSFLSNFDNIYNGSETPSLTILWSVSIEEQFYLFWPILFSLFTVRSKWIPLVGILVISLLSRVYFLHSFKHLNANTLCVISDMAVGGLLAWLAFTKHKIYWAMLSIKRGAIILAYCVGICLCLTVQYWAEPAIMRVFERVILAVFFAFVIFEQTFHRQPIMRFGNSDVLVKLGQVSYGLYCFHYLCLLIAIKFDERLGLNSNVFGVTVIDNLVGLAITVLASFLSYRFFESYFLKLKERFQFIKSGNNVEPGSVYNSKRSKLILSNKE